MNQMNLVDFIRQGLPPTVVVFDTETTGFTSKQKSMDDPSQVRVCQFGLVVVDTHTRKVMNSFDFIVEVPHVPAPVAAIHGITTEMSQDFGLNEAVSLVAFNDAIREHPVIAHNIKFDYDQVACIAARQGMDNPLDKGQVLLCTMEGSKDYAKVPPTEAMQKRGMTGHKVPNLQEAYKALVNPDGFENSHTAMADVMACLEVFWAVVDLVQNEMLDEQVATQDTFFQDEDPSDA